MVAGSDGIQVDYVFAGLVVTSRDEAVTWYERLLGRPPTFLPNDTEAVWQLATGASIYLLADPLRAGRGITALVVNDLGGSLAEIASRGIDIGRVEEIAGVGLKSVLFDPDGNAVSLLQIHSHA